LKLKKSDEKINLQKKQKFQAYQYCRPTIKIKGEVSANFVEFIFVEGGALSELKILKRSINLKLSIFLF
jgi:hypothetical protein